MKKIRLLNIISSILGVFAITFGICFGILDKPKTVDSTYAIDSASVNSFTINNNFSIVLSSPISTTEYVRYDLRSVDYVFNNDISYTTINTNFNFYKIYFTGYISKSNLSESYMFVLDKLFLSISNGANSFEFTTYIFDEDTGLEYLPINFIIQSSSPTMFIPNDNIFIESRFAPTSAVRTITTKLFIGDEIIGLPPINILNYNNVRQIVSTNLNINLFYLNNIIGGLFSSDNYFYGVNVGESNVINSPNNYNLYSESQYISNYYSGVTNVVNNPNEYDLYSYTEYTNYGVDKYNEGIAYATDNDLNFYNFLKTLFHAPVDIFKGAVNFSLPLGNGNNLNLLPLMTFLLTLGIALAIIKLIKGGK